MDGKLRVLFGASTATEANPPVSFLPDPKEVLSAQRLADTRLNFPMNFPVLEKHCMGNCAEVLLFMALQKRPIVALLARRRVNRTRTEAPQLLSCPPCLNCVALQALTVKRTCKQVMNDLETSQHADWRNLFAYLGPDRTI